LIIVIKETSKLLKLYYCLTAVHDAGKACITGFIDDVSDTSEVCIASMHDADKVCYHVWVITGMQGMTLLLSLTPEMPASPVSLTIMTIIMHASQSVTDTYNACFADLVDIGEAQEK
jgi:hypothetical protein